MRKYLTTLLQGQDEMTDFCIRNQEEQKIRGTVCKPVKVSHLP